LVGKREVYSFSEPESIYKLEDDKYIYSLPIFVDMNISAEYRYSKKVSAFIQFNNFTAKKIPVLAKFPCSIYQYFRWYYIKFLKC
jgi:hypothetical protein